MERTVPFDLQAERATLGAILLERDAIIAIAPWLSSDYFYLEKHALVYDAMLACYNRREPPDLGTVAAELRRHERLDLVGGLAFLGEISAEVPTAVHVEYYARIVERTAVLRRLIEAGGKIAALGYDETNELEATLDKAEAELFNVSQRRSTQDFVPISQVVNQLFTQIESLQERRGEVAGVATGYNDLDSLTGGLQRSDLIILAARPSVGKCLAHWSLVDDPVTGERMTIEEAVRRQLPSIYGLSAAGMVRPTRVSAWVDSGVQPCFRVRTHSGRQVDVTAHHPFRTRSGWQPLHDLQPGVCIAVPRALPIFGNDERWSIGLVRLLAYLLGGGELTGFMLTFTSSDPQAMHDFGALMASHFPTSRLRRRGNTYAVLLARPGHRRKASARSFDPLSRWLAEVGLLRRPAHKLHLPACVWRWSRCYLAEFLRILVVCHGLSRQSGAPDAISLSMRSARLAADLQHAFVRFGLLARREQTCDQAWQLVLNDPASLQRYHTQIAHLAEQAAPVLAAEAQLADPSNAIVWDALESITPIGAHQVYDLCVPDGANFIAEDICVHNTSLALSLAYNVAYLSRGTVGVFSLEMSREQLVQRILAMHTGIDMQRLRTGNLRADELNLAFEGMGVLSELPIYIEDTPGLTITEVRAKARRLHAEAGIDMLMIDYLQLMSGRRSDNRVQEVSEISRGLKALARELNVPVIALSQLSRAVEGRQSHVPMLSDLRESGCLAGESLVYLPDEGTSCPIADLVGRTGFNILALNPATWQLELRPVLNAFSTGTQPVYRLTTVSGRTIRATGNHKFLTPAGWQRLDRLTAQDRLAVPQQSPEYATATLDQVFSEGYRGTVAWESISLIEPAGTTAVYDLTVAGLHNFVANQITVHNSIEQDADIVMFIYREELYDKETDKKGLAEIHLAKHRNGPLGIIPLRFEARTTRFQNLERYQAPEGY